MKKIMDSDNKSKYEESHTSGTKKGSSSNAGYNEQNPKQQKEPKENPAPHAKKDKPRSKASD